jgi:hypothetical protein
MNATKYEKVYPFRNIYKNLYIYLIKNKTGVLGIQCNKMSKYILSTLGTAILLLRSFGRGPSEAEHVELGEPYFVSNKIF